MGNVKQPTANPGSSFSPLSISAIADNMFCMVDENASLMVLWQVLYPESKSKYSQMTVFLEIADG